MFGTRTPNPESKKRKKSNVPVPPKNMRYSWDYECQICSKIICKGTDYEMMRHLEFHMGKGAFKRDQCHKYFEVLEKDG